MGENTRYYFQHPENGFPMLLKLSDAGLPEVVAGESDSADAPHWVAVAESDAEAMTKALAKRDFVDLHEAAEHLCLHFHCHDIFS